MVVISDTGPLLYLFLIGHLDILPTMFGRVILPRAVLEIELSDESTARGLRKFLENLPEWLSIYEEPLNAHPEVASLGRGERNAISLMLELNGDLLLCDDSAARKRAIRLGVEVMGTLGLIDEAGFRGLIDFESAIERLVGGTSFHPSVALIEEVRERHRQRKELK